MPKKSMDDELKKANTYNRKFALVACAISTLPTVWSSTFDIVQTVVGTELLEFDHLMSQRV